MPAARATVRRSAASSPAASRLQRGLRDRDLLDVEHARELAELFKVLANDTRLRLLHAIVRAGEIRVSDLASAIGMKPQAVSNQLQRLVLMRIVGTRREGNNILYRIIDPCVPTLLSYGLCLATTASGECTS